MANVSNHIGGRGEAIFESVMTTFHGELPLFDRPRQLGEKQPDIDYLCELIGPWKKLKPFFLIQVKGTRNGYTLRTDRLKVQISKDKAIAISRYKVPVYVAGVDITDERVFIVAAAGKISGLSSIHTGTELNEAGRLKLWTEVRDYWLRVSKPAGWTHLNEPSWK